MKLLKPAWVSHEGRPIFSVDMHPDGSRFATGGQGDDCGRVVIWNMEPVMFEEVEKDENVPKLLCQMDNHLACVNCVRWSVTGRYLASCGDDKTILIWQHAGSGGSVFGGVSAAESWRCVATLRSHSGDILDLAWAPHDAWLASCSVDNTIIVWNALNFPEIVTLLKGHTGLVKGVIWDPVGKFLASQSDDKTLKIWRTSDWKEETSITEPFKECGGTTHVLRMGWSPDGQYLVSAHAMNGGGPTAQIIEREGWVTDKDFVGHRKAITCVRFNNNIMLKSLPHMSKPQQYCCCAIGSRDRSLSVWLTALKRPLVIIKELFNDSVLDLTWSFDGLVMMACSWDGTIACVQFEETEIGKALSINEKKALHERMYGKYIQAPNSLASKTIVETSELLSVCEAQDKKQTAAIPSKITFVNKQPSNLPASPIRGPSKQIETRTSDGKRRITPMYIPTVTDNGEAPKPFSSAHATFSSSTETKSKIEIEKREDIVVPPNVSKPSEELSIVKISAPALELPSAQESKPECPATPPPNLADDADEKSRTSEIAPVSSAEKPGSQKVKELSPSPEDKSKKVLSVEPPLKKVRRRGRPPLSEKIEREKSEKVTTPLVHTQQVQAPVAAASPTKQPPVRMENEVKLPELNFEKSLSVQVPGCPGKVLNIENSAIASSYGPLNVVKCFYSNKISSSVGANWESILSSKAMGAACNSMLVAVCCENKTLHVFETLYGRRPLPPMQLSSRVSKLIISRGYVFVLTVKGLLCVWDVPAKKALVADKSILHLLEKSASVVSCYVTENGSPAVTLSTGKVYYFCSQLDTWLLLADGKDPVQQSSSHNLYANMVNQSGIVSSVPMPPLNLLQSSIKVHFHSSATKDSVSAAKCTLTFLEQQMASSRLMQSARDYHLNLSALVRFLVHEGLENRLRLICNELLGPAHPKAPKSRSWDSKILGLPKHQLLRETLRIVASNLSLQRLYLEYQELLENVCIEQGDKE